MRILLTALLAVTAVACVAPMQPSTDVAVLGEDAWRFEYAFADGHAYFVAVGPDRRRTLQEFAKDGSGRSIGPELPADALVIEVAHGVALVRAMERVWRISLDTGASADGSTHGWLTEFAASRPDGSAWLTSGRALFLERFDGTASTMTDVGFPIRRVFDVDGTAWLVLSTPGSLVLAEIDTDGRLTRHDDRKLSHGALGSLAARVDGAFVYVDDASQVVRFTIADGATEVLGRVEGAEFLTVGGGVVYVSRRDIPGGCIEFSCHFAVPGQGWRGFESGGLFEEERVPHADALDALGADETGLWSVHDGVLAFSPHAAN